MQVLGYFPDFAGTMYYPSAKIYRFPENNPGARELVDSGIFMSQIRGAILSAAGRDASIYLPNDPETHFGPFNCTKTGVPLPPPPTKYIELWPKKSTNNGARWKKRVRTKEIIVSPYVTGVLECTFSNGKLMGKPQSPILRAKDLSKVSLFPIYSRNRQWVVINGMVYETGSIMYYASRNTLTEVVAPPDISELIAQQVRAKIGHNQDGILVTDCLARANRGTIDALTAMAEFPETLRSLLDLVKRCMNIYKDARIKSFRLYNKAKKQSDINQSQADLAKNANELADAIANVWLNFRYNITPNVETIKDIIKTLDTQMKEFVRFRETKNVTEPMEFSTPGWTYTSDFFATHRVMIKRLLEISGRFPKLQHLVLSNVVVTGYELVPFSFVFDWFINLGDCIAAWFVSPEFTQQGATYSWKYTGNATFTHTETNATMSANLKAYKCNVINPLDASCLAFNPDLGLLRQLDAMALTWSVFKEEIQQILSRALRE